MQAPSQRTWPRPNDMKSTVPSRNKKAKTSVKRDRPVSTDEMRRLMHVYGPIKCLRKRGPPGGGTNTKDKSVKRKFYRWFPDLNERFEREEGTGRFVPKAGHEPEVSYREEMRAKDGEVLAKKRVSCRMKRGGYKAKAKGTMPAPNFPTSVPPDDTMPTYLFAGPEDEKWERKVATVTGIKRGVGPDLMASADVSVAGDGPFENAFIAEEGVFDAVDESFFGPLSSLDKPAPQDPTLAVTWSSCGSDSLKEEGRGLGGLDEASWDTNSASIKDMLDKSIEECYEEIWGAEEEGDTMCLLGDTSVTSLLDPTPI